jgi:hypothetical protein
MMIETWEQLQARLLHLGWLAEELPAFVARPSGAWLYRQIVRECQVVARIATEYIAETERALITNPPRTSTPSWETDPGGEACSGDGPTAGGGAL